MCDFHLKFVIFFFFLHFHFYCIFFSVLQQNDRYHWSVCIHFHVPFTYRFGPSVAQNFLCWLNFSIIFSLSLLCFFYILRYGICIAYLFGTFMLVFGHPKWLRIMPYLLVLFNIIQHKLLWLQKKKCPHKLSTILLPLTTT